MTYFPGSKDAPTHATSAATEGNKGDESKPEGKFLTQAQLDAMIKERVEPALKPFADYDDLKAKATAADDATRSESEKQQARLAELEQNAARLAQERARLVLENASLVAATEVGLPAKAALKLADLDKAEYDADGNLTNAKAFAEAVATEYPALITGGATGIGRAIALRFAQEGAAVVVADINAVQGRETAVQAGGLFVACDTTQPTQARGQ